MLVLKTNIDHKMEDFEEIYQDLKIRYEDEFEQARKQAQKKENISNIICITLIILIIFLIRDKYVSATGILMVLFISVGLKLSDKYTLNFKEKVIKPFIERNFNSLKYTPCKELEKEFYEEAILQRRYNYLPGDYIEGTTLGGMKIEMAVLKERVRRTPDSYIFEGMCAKIQLQESVDFEMKIKFRKRKLIIDLKNYLKNYKKMHMNLPEFEEDFTAYTSDEAKCMKILTPDVMRLMLELKNTKNLTAEIILKYDRLYIRFETRDLFKPDKKRNNLERQTFCKYYDTINSILEFSEKMTKSIMENNNK